MERNDGGPAFPYKGKSVTRDTTSGTIVNEKEVYYPGISTRDWFAGMALQGMLSGPWKTDSKGLWEEAYLVADAMLKERENGTR